MGLRNAASECGFGVVLKVHRWFRLGSSASCQFAVPAEPRPQADPTALNPKSTSPQSPRPGFKTDPFQPGPETNGVLLTLYQTQPDLAPTPRRPYGDILHLLLNYANYTGDSRKYPAVETAEYSGA